MGNLADSEIHPWNTLERTLGALGVPENLHADVRREVAIRNNPAIEPSRLDGKYKNPPPSGVTVTEPMARAVLDARVGQDDAALQQKMDVDANGVSNWEKLTPEMRIAVRDAYYNGQGLVGPGLTNVLQHQEDPAWRDKAWWELAVNVKNPNARRDEEANAFTTNSMLKSPVSLDDYSKSVLEKVQLELKDGMSPPNGAGTPVAQGPLSGDSVVANRPDLTPPSTDFARVAWRPPSLEQPGNLLNSAAPPPPEPEVRLWDEERGAGGPTPGNLLNVNALPENLLNMPDYELRRWGLR